MKLACMTLTIALAVLLAGTASSSEPAKKAEPQVPSGKASVIDTPVDVGLQDDARKVAEAYLKAIAHQGGAEALDTLLGGATLSAKAASIPDFKVVAREKHRHEAGQLENLRAFVTAVDAAGRGALAKLSGAAGGPTGDLEDVTAEEATRILEPTRRKAKVFQTSHPVFAYLARVDRPVYWHPANPFRKLLQDAGEKGDYQADLDLFWIESSREGGPVRKWPLRVVRFNANGKDTGLKILPASDWNAE
jgi:hypothetical protein